MSKKLSKAKSIALVALISFLLIAASGLYGVTRFSSSIHVSDSRNNNTTATPVLMVDGKGAGVAFEVRDNATPVFQVPNGGGFVAAGDVSFTGDVDATSNLSASDEMILGAQSTYTVVAGEPITPTGTYLPMSAAALGVNVTDVVTPTSATIGALIVLHNIDSTDVITIDGTGKIVSCKADVALAPQDTLTMLWNGTNWVCLSNYDNS